MKKLSLFLIVTFLSFFSLNLFAYVGSADSPPAQTGAACTNAPKSTSQNESWVDGNKAATHVAILNPLVGAQNSSGVGRSGSSSTNSPVGNDEGAGGTSGGSGSGRGNVK